jgi:hypothetical protein
MLMPSGRNGLLGFTQVDVFIRNYFDFKHSFIGVVAGILVGFVICFW